MVDPSQKQSYVSAHSRSLVKVDNVDLVLDPIEIVHPCKSDPKETRPNKAE